MQSAFTGLGQTLAYLTPSILVYFGLFKGRMGNNIPNITMAAFLIGAVASIGSVMVSIKSTPELKPPEEELDKIKHGHHGVFNAFKEIFGAVGDMPATMWQLSVMMLFQWYAMFCYWQYNSLSVAKTIFNTTDPKSEAFVSANLWANQCNAVYNAITFASSFILVRIAAKFGAKKVHMFCLLLVGISLWFYPSISNKYLLFVPMIGLGVAWASMMSMPYVMVAGSIPPERTGVYLGIFNMFIVIPMLIETATLRGLYNTILLKNPENVIRFAGVLLLCAAVATTFVKYRKPQGGLQPVAVATGH
jgi:maltose/moltooligosaccharide transporter